MILNINLHVWFRFLLYLDHLSFKLWKQKCDQTPGEEGEGSEPLVT